MSTTTEERHSRPQSRAQSGSIRVKSAQGGSGEREAIHPNRDYYKARLPRKDDGTHMGLHRGLTPRLQRKDTQHNHEAYGPCINILHKQRASTRNFASAVQHSAKYVRRISERLYSHYDVRFKPAEAKGREPIDVAYYTLTPKPIYTAAEVKDIVNRLSKNNNEKDKNNGNAPPPRIPSRKGYYPADLVCEIVRDNYNATQATKQRPRSCKARILSTVPAEIARDVRTCEKKADADETTKRISRYDSRYAPAESKGHRTATPPLNQEQKQSSKKMSDEEVGQVVDRLNNYDNRNWPPESRGCRVKLEDKK